MSDLAGKLVGSWQLQHWKLSYPDTGQERFVYGDQPEGLLLYTADGWMSAAIGRRGRAPFPAVKSHRELDQDLIGEAYHSYFHYAGPYRVEGDVVIHSVSMSLNPNFPGTEQRRLIDLQGDVLVLTGEDESGGRARQHQLTWLRTGSEG